MYCFSCNKPLQPIQQKANDLSLNCGNCASFLGLLDAKFTITYCDDCDLYSMAEELKSIQSILENQKYKLKKDKEKPRVICFIDDYSDGCKEPLRKAIQNAFKVKSISNIDLKDIQYVSKKNTNEPSSLYEIVTLNT
jgi:hypothetical protein